MTLDLRSICNFCLDGLDGLNLITCPNGRPSRIVIMIMERRIDDLAFDVRTTKELFSTVADGLGIGTTGTS